MQRAYFFPQTGQSILIFDKCSLCPQFVHSNWKISEPILFVASVGADTSK